MTTRTTSAALDLAAAAHPTIVEATTRAARVTGLPVWSRDLPRGGGRRRAKPDPDADAVYLPSCLNTLFAPAAGGPGVMAAVRSLADRAGIRLRIPDGIGGLCCGTPWSSKGVADGYEIMRARISETLGGTAIPVISDAASCTEGLQRILIDVSPDVHVVDAVTFVAEHVLPRLRITRRLPSVVLHPTCSSTHLGLEPVLTRIAAAVAEKVVIPDGWQCCAFAGDRGLLHPELTASATREEAEAVTRGGYAAHASVNHTCELAMTRATGRTYRHLLELLHAATAA